MKKLALAIALMGSIGSANAAGLSIDTSDYVDPAVNIAAYNGDPVASTGAVVAGTLGALIADVAGRITFTYLGDESGHDNKFSLWLGSQVLTEANGIGDSVSADIGDGLVDFKFTDTFTNPDTDFANGDVSTSILGFAFLTVTAPVGTPYQYYIGFNDTFDKDADYDDYVIGVNFSPVPVPAALPLMATALGLFGFGASRRRV
ncbi:MAG: hypothetical protein V4570_06680 [Pseudomonadota bacterium]